MAETEIVGIFKWTREGQGCDFCNFWKVCYEKRTALKISGVDAFSGEGFDRRQYTRIAS
jgi:hypothetical protein